MLNFGWEFGLLRRPLLRLKPQCSQRSPRVAQADDPQPIHSEEQRCESIRNPLRPTAFICQNDSRSKPSI